MTGIEERLTADSTADLEKLTDMVEQLTYAVWGPDWGVFSEEYPTGNEPEVTKLPHITYLLSSRVRKPGSSLKPQVFNSFPDPEHKGETITLSREWFVCELEFHVYAQTNHDSRKLSEKLEALIELYKGHFKLQGVTEFLFLEEIYSESGGSDRQGIPKRVLRYKVTTERITESRSYELRQIALKIEAIALNLKAGEQGYAARFGKEPHGLSNISNKEIQAAGNDFLSIYEKNFPKQKEDKQ